MSERQPARACLDERGILQRLERGGFDLWKILQTVWWAEDKRCLPRAMLDVQSRRRSW